MSFKDRYQLEFHKDKKMRALKTKALALQKQIQIINQERAQLTSKLNLINNEINLYKIDVKKRVSELMQSENRNKDPNVKFLKEVS